MTPLASVSVIQDLREAVVKVNLNIYLTEIVLTLQSNSLPYFFDQINHAQVEILHAVEMVNVIIQQDYALAMRGIKELIVPVISNELFLFF